MKHHSHFNHYTKIKISKLSGPAILLFVLSISVKTFGQYPDAPIPIGIDANWTLEQNQAYAAFGSSVSGAGDVNGDGYSDVIVGAPFYDNGQTDEGVALLYYGSATGLIATPGWSFQSNQAGAELGFSVSSAGDVNNDGYSDVIIGAPYYDNGQNNEGRAYVFLGHATGLATTAIWIGEPDSADALFGYSVAGSGDVNGDSYDDIIVSATEFDVLEGCCYEVNGAGMVFGYFGNATGIQSDFTFTATDYDNESGFGNDVGSAGDINGDGYSDVLIAAYATGFDGEGCIHVYAGGPEGLNPISIWGDCGGPDGALLGTSSATAGDVNGDGYDDIIASSDIGDGYCCGGQPPVINLYYGSAAGLPTSPSWAVDGNELGIGNGSGVNTAGDVNGDGYDDIIFGSAGYSHPQSAEGVIYVLTGGPAGMPGTTLWADDSNQPNAILGRSVSGAGDINGDGYDDFIAGAPNYDNGQTDEGQARVYLGNPGCITPPVVTLDFTDNVCHDDGIITLTQGLPAGGTYTGTGIIGTDQFDPAIAGIGTHAITYTYIAAGGCSATASDNLVVSGNPSANTTLGSASLNLCTSNPVVLVANAGTGLTYQWYKNGIALPGEIYLAYLAYATGNYQVQTTNVDGCSKMSKKKKVTHSGCRMEGEITEELFPIAIGIYPNPNNGNFNFQFQSSELINGDVDIFISDMSGRLINQSVFQSMDGMVIGNININLPTGIYILKIVQDGINQTGNFIVN